MELCKAYQEKLARCENIDPKGTYKVTVPITWFEASLKPDSAVAVFQNPETGEVTTRNYNLRHYGTEGGGNAWGFFNNLGCWTDCGDRPTTAYVSVSGKAYVTCVMQGLA